MQRRFLALRIVSIIFKILGVLNFIGMIGAAVAELLIGTVVLFAISQYIDLMMAIEINTRASNALLQRMGKVMKERL